MKEEVLATIGIPIFENFSAFATWLRQEQKNKSILRGDVLIGLATMYSIEEIKTDSVVSELIQRACFDTIGAYKSIHDPKIPLREEELNTILAAGNLIRELSPTSSEN